MNGPGKLEYTRRETSLSGSPLYSDRHNGSALPHGDHFLFHSFSQSLKSRVFSYRHVTSIWLISETTLIQSFVLFCFFRALHADHLRALYNKNSKKPRANQSNTLTNSNKYVIEKIRLGRSSKGRSRTTKDPLARPDFRRLVGSTKRLAFTDLRVRAHRLLTRFFQAVF